jgi:hypothetical protein
MVIERRLPDLQRHIEPVPERQWQHGVLGERDIQEQVA